MLERTLQRRAVFVEAAHRDCDIAPAAAAVAHKGYRLRRRELTFGHHAVRRHELHRIVQLALKAHSRVAEHILGEEIERVAAGSRREMPRLRLRAKLPGIGEKLARTAAGQLENLVLAVQLVQSQAHGELHAALQNRAQHLPLLKREIYESVNIYMVVRSHGAVEYLPGKHSQTVGRVGVSVRYDGVVGFKDQRHVRKLVPKPAGAVLRGRIERPGIDSGGLQAVHRREQRRLRLRPAPRRTVHAQSRRRAVQRQRHAQQPPALIEIWRRAAALLGRYAPRKPGEAHNLGVQRHTVAADAAQLALRLMAVLLRNYEQAASLLFENRRMYFIYDRCGLARTGAAGKKSQHY